MESEVIHNVIDIVPKIIPTSLLMQLAHDLRCTDLVSGTVPLRPEL